MRKISSEVRPLISVGIPVYNGGAQIEKALNSLICQDYKNIEIVISDNASTDNTRQICEQFCRKDTRFKYILQSTNIGPTRNFRKVLEIARGKYFMWLGHDDWLSPDYIDNCALILENNPDVSLVCGQAIYYKDGNEFYRGKIIHLNQVSSIDRVISYYEEVADNGAFYGLMRRGELLKIKSNNVMGGDWLLIASVAFTGKIVCLPSVIVHRALGGATVSYQKIAHIMSLPRIQEFFPHVAASFAAFKDIMWRNPIYNIPFFSRLNLAWRCQFIIRNRHDSSVLEIISKGYFLLKQFIGNKISNK